MISRLMRGFTISVCVLIACAALASAQDAGQVLGLSVRYNTLKNSKEMSSETRAKVERLGKLAQEARQARKLGEAAKHLYHAIALMNGAEWKPARALATALTFKPERAMLEPAQTVSVRVGQMFSLDEKPEGKLAASVALLKMRGDEPVAVLKSLDSFELDTPLSVEVTVPEVENGSYRLAVMITEAGVAAPIIKAATIRIDRGLAQRVEAAKTRAAKAEARLKRDRKEALAYEVASAQYRIGLFDLASAGSLAPDRIDFDKELKEAGEILSALEAKRDPFARRRGDFKKAYRSQVDNTLQPYRVFVPSSYDGSKPYPLIIALHGMGGDENSYFDFYKDDGKENAFKIEAERHGYIVACPKGREPASMYVGAAERDVMDVIAEIKRAYRIDLDRIYMTGHSMGGFGTWSIAMNHPEVFAALAPVAGGGNAAQMGKIAHIPQLVVHGDDDRTVSVENSRSMVEAAKKLNVEVKYIEIARGDHVTVASRTFKDVFEWFNAHKRNGVRARPATGSSGN